MPYLVESYAHRTLTLPMSDGAGDATLRLESRLALGDRGAVYPLDPRSHIPGVTVEGPLVAKIPHSVRLTRPPVPHPEAELEMKREAHTWRLLHDNLAAIEADAEYPRNPAWARGRFPVAEILAVIPSRHGTILIKPRISGPTLEKLIAENPGGLPPEMIASLREIYALTRAITPHVRTPVVSEDGRGWADGRPFLTDVNPANLVWVSEPAELTRLGLSRPSFVFYELTPLLNRQPQYIALPPAPAAPR